MRGLRSRVARRGATSALRQCMRQEPPLCTSVLSLQLSPGVSFPVCDFQIAVMPEWPVVNESDRFLIVRRATREHICAFAYLCEMQGSLLMSAQPVWEVPIGLSKGSRCLADAVSEKRAFATDPCRPHESWHPELDHTARS